VFDQWVSLCKEKPTAVAQEKSNGCCFGVGQEGRVEHKLVILKQIKTKTMNGLDTLKHFITRALGVECKTNSHCEQNAFWRLPSGTVEIAGDPRQQIYISLLRKDCDAEFTMRRDKDNYPNLIWKRTIRPRAGERVVYRDLDSEGQEWHTCLAEHWLLMLATFLYTAKTDTALLQRPLNQLASFRDAKFAEFAIGLGVARRIEKRDSSPVRKPARRSKLAVAELCN
jgi:hypothetical protein